MADVVSFRPNEEEELLIERTRRSLGSRTRTEAVRYLIQQAARSVPLSEDPVFQFRVPERFRSRRSVSSREIDEELYGGSG